MLINVYRISVTAIVSGGDMRHKKGILIFFILVLLLTAFIFSNSFKNVEESHEDSNSVLKVVLLFLGDIVDLDYEDVSFFVRKAAHLVEFCCLGMAVKGFLLQLKKDYEKTFYGWGCFYALAVAVTDEYIQGFSDRTSSVKDVLLDFSGALLGILFVTLVVSMIRDIRQRRGLRNRDISSRK